MISAYKVFPKGFEPLSVEPESTILSIELRERAAKILQWIVKQRPEAHAILTFLLFICTYARTVQITYH